MTTLHQGHPLTASAHLHVRSLRTVLAAVITSLAWVGFVPTALAAPQATLLSETRLVEAAAAGGSLVLPAGLLVLSQPLVITRDFSLSGAGPEDTTIQNTGSGTAVRVEGGAVVSLGDLRIDATGSSEAGSFGTDLIQVLDGSLTLDRTYLSGARYGAPDDLKPYGYGVALFVAGSATATVTSTLFQLNELVVVEATGTSTVSLRQTSFDRNIHGAFAEEDATLTVSDSLIVGTEESALTVRGRATATITSNTFSVNGVDPATGYASFDALRIGEEATVSLRGNLIEGNPRYALSLYGTATVTAEGNTYRSNGGHDEVEDVFRSSLLLEDSSRYVSNGDQFLDNPGGAIEVIHDSSMLLDTPTITGNGSYASVWVDDTADVVLIGANFADNEGGLFVMGEATLFLERGSFTTTASDAVDASGSSEVTAVEATFADNDGAGIYAYGGAVVTVHRSTFRSNLAGLVASETASFDIEGSAFTQNTGAGVLFLDTSSGSVRSSVFQGNGGLAVDVRPTAEVVLEGNEER